MFMEIYERLRDLREDHDLRQCDVAEILKTTQSYYAKYEKGHRPLPTHHLVTLCKYYNVSPEYILGFTNTPKPLPKD